MDDDYDYCEIQFFGGEPFYEYSLIKSICDFIWSKEWPKKYQCFATTNGTLIHGEIRQWLWENKDKFTCALSLDGNREAHNINRCNSFDMIDIDFFKNTWPNQTAKMTISPESLPFLAESVLYLHNQNINFDNNLAYGVDWTNVELLKIMQEQLGILAKYYIENPEIKPCRLLDMHIENVNYAYKIRKWCGAGTSLRAYDTEGKCYPCHLFQPISLEQSENSVDTFGLFERNDCVDTRCANCPIYNICPTCYGYNYSAMGDIAKRDEGLCKFTMLASLVSSYIWLKKFERYTPEKLGLDMQIYRMIFDGAKLIQKKIPLLLEK